MEAIKQTLLNNKKPLLLFILITAGVIFLFGSNFWSLVHNELELRKLARQSAQLDKEHTELLETLKRLEEQDPVYLEKLARTQYNMAKPGEMEFRFKKK